ncbi:MAG: hypothetical protein DI548_14650 [Flavobacterium johnsoniae]|nr:MAG: hypothetical protein DI548_14650 [Flavobacterium johnsoniae]
MVAFEIEIALQFIQRFMTDYIHDQNYANEVYTEDAFNLKEFEVCHFSNCDFTRCNFIGVTFTDCTVTDYYNIGQCIGLRHHLYVDSRTGNC